MTRPETGLVHLRAARPSRSTPPVLRDLHAAPRPSLLPWWLLGGPIVCFVLGVVVGWTAALS